ncbi:MAG TPA: ATP-binding protein [Vicinamibacterales bacterium]|nr:ATP-binding protein [Vicinamibacterales bacterium]
MKDSRRPLRDNPRLILAGMILLLAALAGIVALANRSARLSPDFLTEFVLYGLWAADLTILLGLTFVLARNVIKLVVERRRALPFARFRGKLVAVLLGMTLVPAVLVLLVGSEVIRNSVDRWFNAPVEDVMTAADLIASDYYRDRQARVADDAERMAQALAGSAFDGADVTAVRDRVFPEVAQGRVKMVEVYGVRRGPQGVEILPYVDVASPDMPQGYARAVADRMASHAASGQIEPPTPEPLPTGGELIRAAAVVHRAGTNNAIAVVVASDFLTGELASRARRITDAFEAYSQLRVLRRPLAGVYLSFFLMMTLMILVGATWMGLYLAKRITEPVQRLATAAREIEAGHLDYRVDRGTVSDDEFGSLVEAFNSMANEVGKSRRRLERSTNDLERKHVEVEGRRRYIETILERIATGVVSIDTSGTVSTLNSAAMRLLGLDMSAVGRPAVDVFGREDLQPFGSLLRAAAMGKAAPSAQEIALTRDERELQLAAVATVLHGTEGSDGMVLVLDDVTPLIRAQKVAAWREVARRLAHEIKNPLTPIQLCAERMRRHFTGAPAATQALVEECTSTIVGEVDSLKALVDEFSQFARMPAPRAAPADLHVLLNDALALYQGLLGEVQFERRFAAQLPKVRVDGEQIRRVIINLVDNAIEAMNRSGVITVETQHDAGSSLVRLLVSDNGPGIPVAEREKLFMPYYSTKRRGSGLGLAIVRRIVAEHGGTIEVGENEPRGTRFTIELPC